MKKVYYVKKNVVLLHPLKVSKFFSLTIKRKREY